MTEETKGIENSLCQVSKQDKFVQIRRIHWTGANGDPNTGDISI